MSTPLLVRHPAPQPTEGLRGYVLRLAQDNGYRSPWNVFCLAGMKQHEARDTRIRIGKLAKVCNWSQPFIQVADRAVLDMGSGHEDRPPALECGRTPVKRTYHSASIVAAKIVMDSPLGPPNQELWNQQGGSTAAGASR